MHPYQLEPGQKLKLGQIDCDDTSLFKGSKQDGKAYLLELNDRLEKLQELLWAQGKHKVLVVLQAMDTAGKDGTIRHVFEGVNPQGVRVASFKKPSSLELSHDYLWRVHKQAPAAGELVIFNRSHYEDVLVVRVLKLVSESQWRARYHHIREFERMLAEEGTTIIKIFLHITKAEQKQRLQARLVDPDKHWKFAAIDLEARAQWDNYQAAYQEALVETTTTWAPWHVVPANAKWYRNIVISEILIDTLERLDMSYPAPEPGLDTVVIDG